MNLAACVSSGSSGAPRPRPCSLTPGVPAPVRSPTCSPACSAAGGNTLSTGVGTKAATNYPQGCSRCSRPPARPGRSGTCARRHSVRPGTPGCRSPTSTRPSAPSPSGSPSSSPCPSPRPATSASRRCCAAPTGSRSTPSTAAATYTSTGILDAERRLLEAAERTDGHTVQDIFVQLAIGRATENGTPLDPGQADLVSRLATSGARVQVALAPAGSGKTTAMATLAKAWRAGGGDVVGLAPTAVAAAELGAAIDTPAETVAKFLHATSLAADDSRVAAFPPVGPRTLLVVDEAGMVGTKDLAAVVDHVLARGGSVRLVGDDQQLTAVAASGVFRDLAELGDRTGTTVRLTELHRFTDPAEATATLGIRDGDPDALEHYLTRGRVHVGDAGTAADQAYDAWRADITAGRSSLLLAASRDVVRDLNEQARADRLAGQRPTREVRLADGTHASAGDLVVTRHNDRSLRTRSGTWVKNGDRWAVRSVGPDGALLVAPANRRAGGHESVTLPAGYVEQHVQLGYAGTIHGAQGATVDTTHTVLAGTESRQSLYVALSRGRLENHLYLGDGATPAEDVPLGTQPPDDGPRDLLARILDHDERAESATRAGTPDPHHELATLVQQYEDALPLLAQHVLGDERMRCPRRRARTVDAWAHLPARVPGSTRPDRDQMGGR